MSTNQQLWSIVGATDKQLYTSRILRFYSQNLLNVRVPKSNNKRIWGFISWVAPEVSWMFQQLYYWLWQYLHKYVKVHFMSSARSFLNAHQLDYRIWYLHKDRITEGWERNKLFAPIMNTRFDSKHVTWKELQACKPWGRLGCVAPSGSFPNTSSYWDELFLGIWRCSLEFIVEQTKIWKTEWRAILCTQFPNHIQCYYHFIGANMSIACKIIQTFHLN